MQNDYEDDENDELAARPPQFEAGTVRAIAKIGEGSAWRHELVKLIGDSETEDEDEYLESKSSGHSSTEQPGTA